LECVSFLGIKMKETDIVNCTSPETKTMKRFS
jgi:hypothetical protein